jgi:hypothetical protein
MHEAHEPEGPVFTWREIITHISIITVGLLIALGIDQTAEYFHHQHQLAEARQQLADEFKINLFQFKANKDYMKLIIPMCQDDIKLLHYLRQHPGATQDKWPAQFKLESPYYYFDDYAWDNLKQSPVFDYMPYSEQNRIGAFYWEANLANKNLLTLHEEYIRLDTESAIGFDLQHMSSTQIDSLVDKINTILTLTRVIRNNMSTMHMYADGYPTMQDIDLKPSDNSDWSSADELYELQKKYVKEYEAERSKLNSK